MCKKDLSKNVRTICKQYLFQNSETNEWDFSIVRNMHFWFSSKSQKNMQTDFFQNSETIEQNFFQEIENTTVGFRESETNPSNFYGTWYLPRVIQRLQFLSICRSWFGQFGHFQISQDDEIWKKYQDLDQNKLKIVFSPV